MEYLSFKAILYISYEGANIRMHIHMHTLANVAGADFREDFVDLIHFA